MNKVRDFIVARPLLAALVSACLGIGIEWLTAFLRSIQSPPV